MPALLIAQGARSRSARCDFCPPHRAFRPLGCAETDGGRERERIKEEQEATRSSSSPPPHPTPSLLTSLWKEIHLHVKMIYGLNFDFGGGRLEIRAVQICKGGRDGRGRERGYGGGREGERGSRIAPSPTPQLPQPHPNLSLMSELHNVSSPDYLARCNL